MPLFFIYYCHTFLNIHQQFSKMKLTDTNFITANIGQIVYYIFCWVDKDGNLGPESAVYFYTVTA